MARGRSSRPPLRRRPGAREPRRPCTHQPVGVVLDTSVLVAWERAPADWESALGDLGSEPGVIPAIVYAELLVGVRLADDARVLGRHGATKHAGRLGELLAVPRRGRARAEVVGLPQSAIF
ncbi:MAG: PIN domain-containing protein [Candidatus Binatia bacterium]